MAKSNDLYDVKICVRSSVKLLGEIKDLLERNPTRERLFRRTVFGLWLDILSYDNDNHLMHYVLQHHVYVSKIPSDCPPTYISYWRSLVTSTCSSPDMDNSEVSVAGMGIHKEDGQNDIPSANDNAVNQGIIGSANDLMLDVLIQVACDGMEIDKADGNNDYTYSQREPSTLDVLVQGFDSQKNHPGIDVLQHDTHVDCSVAKLNDHPTADICVKAVRVDEFVDDYMDVDELIDVHEDKTTVLQENLKDVSNKSQYVNMVKEDYKPCLGMVFANVKAKRKKCGLERNYVLRSVKERKKRLAMSLDSPFGQQATTTPAPPKTISRSINGDFIAPPEFLEDVSGEPKMRSINELMTLEVFVEIDLMWYFKEPDADWAMASPYFLTCTLGGSMIDYYSNGVRYPVAWRDVEKVYFLVNEPKKHWCLVELHISTGVLTFYDSLGWVCGNRRPWWRTMKRTLPQQLTLYLNELGVLQSKGIAVETYEIKYMFLKVVRQADNYGDYGVWANLYAGFWSRGLMSDVDLVKVFSHGL
ncbi:phospholipase-like protein [Tanacetum coccineum]